MKAIVFVGGGRITGALVAGLRLAGDEQDLIVYDRHVEKLRALRRESRVEMARDLNRHVKSIDNALQRVKRKIEKNLAEIELP